MAKAKLAFIEKTRKWPMFVVVYEDGSRRKFTKHLTWPEAEIKLAEIRNRIELQSFDLADYTKRRLRSERIGDASIDYMAEREDSIVLGGIKVGTFDKDEDSLILLIGYVGKNKFISDIDKKTIQDFVIYLKTEKQKRYGGHYADGSIRSYLKSLSGFFSWNVEKGYCEKNPIGQFFERAGKLSKDQVPKDANEEQIKALREQFKGKPEWHADSFNFSTWTSARASEVLNVKAEDVFVIRKDGHEKMVIRILGKGDKKRMIPVGPECAALVAKRLRWLETGEGMRAAQSRAPNAKSVEIYKKRREQGFLFHDVSNRTSLSNAVLTARRNAGIDRKITFHSARHTYATDMLGQGVPIIAVSKLLGHAEVRTTQIYEHLVDNTIFELVKDVEEV